MRKIISILIFLLTIYAYYNFYKRYNYLILPSRSLKFGDINFIQTTDTHGWLAGHQKQSEPEINYRSDWGDYASFVDHMRQLSLEKDVDLLVIDSGDLHDGSGLSDAIKPGGVNGHETNDIFAMVDIDVLTIGNHGLYNADVSLDIYKNFAPKFEGRYLTSNVNITDPDTNESVPIGERYLKQTTRKGHKFTAFGLLFDFPNPNEIVQLQSIKDLVNEQWFNDAIKDTPDFFLLVAHMAIHDDNWNIIINKLKSEHPHTPIISFGGHEHIRDCKYNYYDKKDVRIAGGRFLETVGWLSVKFLEDGKMEVSRRYIDSNLHNYAYHAGIHVKNFTTKLGREIKKKIDVLWKKFNLGDVIGYIDRDYYQTRVPSNDSSSLVTFLKNEILPTSITNEDRKEDARLIIVNSGAIRYDLYKGFVNKNDLYTAFPFVNTFLYVKDVPYVIASQMVKTMNNLPGQPFLNSLNEDINTSSLGYVTDDQCPGTGDDTDHEKLEYFNQVPCFSTDIINNKSENEEPEVVDVVFLSFLKPSVVKVLNMLSSNFTFEVETYTNKTIRDVVADYLRKNIE